MYPIEFTHLFSDGIVYHEMPDVSVKEWARQLDPPVHSNVILAHLLSIVKVFALILEAGSFFEE